MSLRSAIVVTAIGDLGLLASKAGLRSLLLPQPDMASALRAAAGGVEPMEDESGFGSLPDRLRRFANGQPIDFDDVALELSGTPFQLAVWQVTRSIPWSSTRTYGEIACLLHRPGAARAVGAAEGANPVALIVPCHRVLGSSGNLCGFGGGLPLKARLLEMERSQLPLLHFSTPAG